MKKQKPELIWIGKVNRPRIGQQIFFEGAQKPYYTEKAAAAIDLHVNKSIMATD